MASQPLGSFEEGPPLFTHAPKHGLSFGVLRTRFSNRANDPASYIAEKLAPVLPHGGHWQPTAARLDTLLPSGVPDLFLDPMVLAASYMSHLPSTQTDLLICLKMTLDEDQPLHGGWERARAFAREMLVAGHGLPVVLVLHDPAMSGRLRPNRPHIHALTFARRFAARGWAERSSLARDAAHNDLAEAWRQQR
jgi:hypothetical protein